MTGQARKDATPMVQNGALVSVWAAVLGALPALVLVIVSLWRRLRRRRPARLMRLSEPLYIGLWSDRPDNASGANVVEFASSAYVRAAVYLHSGESFDLRNKESGEHPASVDAHGVRVWLN